MRTLRWLLLFSGVNISVTFLTLIFLYLLLSSPNPNPLAKSFFSFKSTAFSCLRDKLDFQDSVFAFTGIAVVILSERPSEKPHLCLRLLKKLGGDWFGAVTIAVKGGCGVVKVTLIHRVERCQHFSKAEFLRYR